jgi:hypothetical protein
MDQASAISDTGWCILINRGLEPRGARFLISRIDGHKIFLRYDCPLRLWVKDDANISQMEEDLRGDVYFAQIASFEREFILEKRPTPQTLGVPRPQNSQQYSDRLIVIHEVIWRLVLKSENYLSFGLIEELCSRSILFMIAWTIVIDLQYRMVERALYAIVHRAWIATYQPSWNPNRPWKWFWKLMNFEPPIPFKTLMKYYCMYAFVVSMILDNVSGVAMVSLYWLPLFETSQLVKLFVWALIWKANLLGF